jgi:hypothetical protein
VPNDDIAADLDLSLPPLATTPARPNRPRDEAPAAEVIRKAEEPASKPTAVLAETAEVLRDDEVSGDVEVYVEDDSLPATEGTPGEARELMPGLRDGAQAQGPSAAADAATAFEEPTPPAPMYIKTYGSASMGGEYVPAPKEKPEATDTVMRARLGGLLHEQATVKPSDEYLEPDGPKTLNIPVYVDENQRRVLWDETHKLYEAVPDILSGDENQGRALRLLQEAQEILLEKPRQFDLAKFKVGQVQTLVTWRRNVNRWSSTYGWGIFVYEVVWIGALALGVLTAKGAEEFVTRAVESVPAIGGLSRLWSTMLWGGLGGVIGAFYSLYWHVAKVKDFDKKYTLWYVVQPVIGLLLGSLVHLLFGSGVLTGQGVNQRDQSAIVRLFPYAVACVAGFRQRAVLEMMDRVVQVITPSSRPKRNPVEEMKPEEPLDESE